MCLRPSARLMVLVAAIGTAGCRSGRSEEVTEVRHVDRVVQPSSSGKLAGSRCTPGQATCRCRTSDREPEDPPPLEGTKRVEIRLSAEGGEAVLESASLGRYSSAGPQESCFYVDVPAGSHHDVTFTARAASVETGVAPTAFITEYGPAGPYWYDIFAIKCTGGYARCDRAGADAWGASWKEHRKRGRLEPCGSITIAGLAWETSGGLAERDGGFFRDFVVKFRMEARALTPTFAPGTPECVPK